jgi:hypothetical protein
MEAPVALVDSGLVDAGVAPAHQSVFVEFSVLVPVAPPPLSGESWDSYSKPNRNAILGEAPQLLAQR